MRRKMRFFKHLFFNYYIYIYITSGEFHTNKSRIVLNNDGAVITMFIYSILFHMDFNTGLFRRPTKSWSTHQLNSIYTVASLGFTYSSSMIVTKFKLKER